MAITAAGPLLLSVAALGAISHCRGRETRAPTSAPPVPTVQTRLLETRPLANNPPPTAPGLMNTIVAGEAAGRREGGVPESLVVGDDCRVRAVWWISHLCGVTVQGAAAWTPDKGAIFTTAKLDGVGRTDCPSLVTRFETAIEGLANGSYRFGTQRKAVDFTIQCGARK